MSRIHTLTTLRRCAAQGMPFGKAVAAKKGELQKIGTEFFG